MSVPSLTLPAGDRMPVVGCGTWNLDDETTRASVRAALEAGYTHVDTAEGYHNEGAIGDVVAAYDREELFLTSKVLPSNLDYESVIEACEGSLDRLGTDYLDLYLIHWPNPAISLRETLDAMARLHDSGRVRNVGVSNFSTYQLSVAHHVSDVPIAVNQIEFHPWLQRPDLVEYCRETDVAVQAAAPLARTEVLDAEPVEAIARARDRSPAQVVLRWAVERDVVVLPKSSAPAHVRENIDLFDWELSASERRQLDDLDRGEPIYDTRVPEWSDDVYGISR
ncbi:MAG: aldo/keto reductase [Salinirussus sp.]